MANRYYSGVGSRRTPEGMLEEFKKLGTILAHAGYILRSGGAPGADDYFEKGAIASGKGEACAEIYLPWKGFNGRTSPLFKVDAAALKLASQIHPAWERLSQAAQKLHARNCNQVLGLTLDTPADFLVCWTPDGCNSHATRTSQTGGTGSAISLADMHKVPIFNLNNPAATHRFQAFLDERNVPYKVPLLAMPHEQQDLFSAKPEPTARVSGHSRKP